MMTTFLVLLNDVRCQLNDKLWKHLNIFIKNPLRIWNPSSTNWPQRMLRTFGWRLMGNVRPSNSGRLAKREPVSLKGYSNWQWEKTAQHNVCPTFVLHWRFFNWPTLLYLGHIARPERSWTTRASSNLKECHGLWLLRCYWIAIEIHFV